MTAMSETKGIHRLLITGAAGQLGKLARERLRGRYPALRLSDIGDMAPAGAGEEIVPCNLADPFAVAALCESVDAILHLGGRSTEGDWPTILAANVQGAINLWEAARRAGTGRILFASSNHAIGLYRRTETIDHHDRMRPDSRYGVSKVFGESLAELYAVKHGLRGFSIRIGSCFPEPVDARMLSTWLSPDDFIRLVEVGLHADYVYEVVYGVSANTRGGWWDNTNAFRLGYAPQDDSERFAEKVGHLRFDHPAAELTHGGTYVSAEFEGGDNAVAARLP
jgi:uronate dehydrogenase